MSTRTAWGAREWGGYVIAPAVILYLILTQIAASSGVPGAPGTVSDGLKWPNYPPGQNPLPGEEGQSFPGDDRPPVEPPKEPTKH